MTDAKPQTSSVSLKSMGIFVGNINKEMDNAACIETHFATIAVLN